MPRVSIDQSVHPFYSELTDKKPGSSPPIFRFMKDVFMLACTFGARNGVRSPLVKGVDIFDTSALSDDDWATLEAIALTETQDINVLQPPPNEPKGNAAVLLIAEEYANAGIEKLRRSISPALQGVELALALIEEGDTI